MLTKEPLAPRLGELKVHRCRLLAADQGRCSAVGLISHKPVPNRPGCYKTAGWAIGVYQLAPSQERCM